MKRIKYLLLIGIGIGFYIQNVFAIANPASEYCTKNGGTLQIKTGFGGGEYGVCLFEDNRQCEERAMYRGECPIGGKRITGYDNQADIYCAIGGNTAVGSEFSGQAGVCTLKDGSSCSSDYYYQNNSCSGSTTTNIFDQKVQDFCSKTEYSAVYTGMGYIKVVLNNMGGGIQYYTQDSNGIFTGFSCPVVAPNYVSSSCKDISQMTVTWTQACNISSQNTLENAVTWMYKQGFTKYSNTTDFLPNNYLTRQESAKFFAEFAKKIYNKVETPNIACYFNDTLKADSTLKSYITSSCNLGILKGYNSKFLPFDYLTKAQAIAVLMRISGGKLDENLTPWRKNYFTKITDLGVLDTSWNLSNMEINITRGELAILMYNLAQKN